jgi:Flp pilus assembly pilin Flp
MERVRRMLKSERGAAAVEFALVVPVLVLLVFGIIQFGRAYNLYLTATAAAREGARAAAVGGSAAGAVGAFWPGFSTAVSPAPDPTGSGGQYVQVTVSVPYTLRLPLPLGSRDLNIQSTVTMRREV